ncbi:MAG: hypothetical protein ACI9V1_001158 [Spirosomataceae bacterium]|jgi:hypothetical protein
MNVIMQTYSVDILHPKAIRLLEDLADLKLITLKEEKAVENEKKPTALQELLLTGPVWSDEQFESVLEARKSISKTGQR